MRNRYRTNRLLLAICACGALLALPAGSARADQPSQQAAAEKNAAQTAAEKTGAEKNADGAAKEAAGDRPAAEKPMGALEPQGPLPVQILLSCAKFSPGEIDGVWGPNTRGALTAFQEHHGLTADGEIDDDTWKALGGTDDAPLLVRSKVTEEDAAGPFVDEMPDDMMEQAKLDSLAYTSVEELLAEKHHVSPETLRELNPDASFEAGSSIWVPNLECSGLDTMMAAELRNDGANSGPSPAGGERTASADASAEGSPNEKTQGEKKAARSSDGGPESGSESGSDAEAEKAKKMDGLTVRVSAETSDLRIFDSSGELIFYAPATAGSEQDPLPKGDWKVVAVARDPTFHYSPELFWDSEPGAEKTTLPPGPNNPVGRVWIDLDKEHYGLHGTPAPGKVGHTASHGCVRLTNWDALKVASMVSEGTEVIFE